MSRWVITDAGGTPIAQIFAATHPRDGATIAWQAGFEAHAVDRFGDEAREAFAGDGWSVSLDLVKAKLLAELDDRREAEQMVYLTAGEAKQLVYAQKAREVADFAGLPAAALAALDADARRARFPAATAEAELTGAPLASVIAGFDAAATASNAGVMRIEALAQAAKTRIRAAASEAEAIAAAAVTWRAA